MVTGRVRCISNKKNSGYYGPEVHDKDFSLLLPNTASTIASYVAEEKSIIL